MGKFNKRLDPQVDVELQPQRQGSSSAIGSNRPLDGPASDPWAAAPAGVPGNEAFGAAFQSAIGGQTPPVLPNEFNALQGLNMLNIRPSATAPQPFSTAPAPNQQPRFQALGLSLMGTGDPFASAFGAPPSMDVGGMDGGWSSTPGVPGVGGLNAFAVPGTAPMSFVPQDGVVTNAFSSSTNPRNAVGSNRAVGGKRGGGGVQVAPGPAAAVADGASAQHGHSSKRHGRHGKGNNGPGPVGAPSGGDNNNGSGKGQKQKNSGNKQGGRRGRGGSKESGENGSNGASAPAAVPRPASGETSGKANNNRRGPRRGGAAKRGDKADNGAGGSAPAPAPMAVPPPAAAASM